MSEDDNWYVAKTQDDGVIARLQSEVNRLRSENEKLKAEVDEQARLNGMGSAREAKLMAEVERLGEGIKHMENGDFLLTSFVNAGQISSAAAEHAKYVESATDIICTLEEKLTSAQSREEGLRKEISRHVMYIRHVEKAYREVGKEKYSFAKLNGPLSAIERALSTPVPSNASEPSGELERLRRIEAAAREYLRHENGTPGTIHDGYDEQGNLDRKCQCGLCQALSPAQEADKPQ